MTDLTVDDGEDIKTVTIPTRNDRELNAMEAILGEFYMRLSPAERARVSRYIADRLYSEYRDGAVE